MTKVRQNRLKFSCFLGHDIEREWEYCGSYLYIWSNKKKLGFVKCQSHVDPVGSEPVHPEQELHRCLELAGEEQDLKSSQKVAKHWLSCTTKLW